MLAWLLIQACKGDAPPPRPPVSTPTGATADTADTLPTDCAGGPTWDTFASGYIQTWCTPCHTEHLVGDEARQGAPEGIDFDTWSQVVAWESRILARATGPSPDMPPLGGTDPSDVARLEEWFACGAPGADDPPGPCDELVWADAVVLADAADVAALCGSANAVRGLTVSADLVVDCVCEVDGDLLLTGSATLPLLSAVHGDLTLAGPTATLPLLREVGGELLVTDARVLSLDLPQLGGVGGPLTATGSSLQTIDLPSLLTVGGDLTLRGTPSTRVDLSRLRSTEGALVLEDLPDLAALVGLGAVERVGGELRLEGIGTLSALDHFRLLEDVGGEITLRDLTHVTTIDGFTVVPTASVRVEAMPALAELDGFDNLRDAPLLTIVDNPRLLNVFGFVNLADAGDVTVARNASLRSLGGLGALSSVDSLTLDALPVPDLPWFTALSAVDGDLRLTRLATLGRVSGLGGFSSVGGTLAIEATGLRSLADLDGLQVVGGDLRVVDNLQLSTAEAQSFAARLGVSGVTVVEGNAP